MQRDGEYCRMAMDGRRTDDGSRCTLVIIHRRSGEWWLFPHGVDRFGVRIPAAAAERIADTIQADTIQGGAR